MLGFVKKYGAYIKGMSDFSKKGKTDFIVDNQGCFNGIQVWMETPEPKLERTAITVGGLYRPWKYLYTYLGAGYGFRNVAYELPNNVWAKNGDRSYEGYEVELGCIFRLGGLSLLWGFQTNQFKYMEISYGVGVIF